MHNTKLMYWERARLIFGATLPARDKYTLLAISDHLGSNDECWPSVNRLQERTGQGRRTVIRALDALEQAGALVVTRATGMSNRYSLNIEWLQDNQCHSDTSATVTPVPPRHPHQCHSDTGGVPPRHRGSATVTPKGDKEGEQGRKSRKDTSKSNRTKALSIQDVQAILPPQELTDALPGYCDAFAAWCEVRKGTSWRQKATQVVSFHSKMLKAHQDGLDVMAALGKAFDSGWQGINASYMQPLTVKRDTKRTPALQKDLKAQYRAYLLGELNK